jgi:hypothetical protein
MKRLLMSVVIVVLLGVNAAAQELYKLQFFDSQSIVLDGLLVWYGPAQPSLLRIRYVDPISRSNLLVEEQITFIQAPGGFVLRGSNPRFLTPPPQGHTYAPDSFIFAPCPNGFFPCVTAIDEVNRVSQVTEFRPLMPNEIATFLQIFSFSTQTPNYTPPWTTPAAPQPTPRPAPRAATMYLIVVADTEASDIGRGNEIDARGLAREFEIAANQSGIAFSPTIISGSSFSKSSVLATLNSLNPGPNDIVVFAFTGHGFRLPSDTDPYPRLDLSRNRQDPAANNLAAMEVFQILKGKGARLTITLVDACNSQLSEDKLRRESGPSSKLLRLGISSPATAALFLNVRANIIVAAASQGERAETDADQGAYFIRSFLDAFRSETGLGNGSTPSWQTIILKAKESASRLSRGKQNAISYVE